MSEFASVFASWNEPLSRGTRRALLVVSHGVMIAWVVASLAGVPYADAALVAVLAVWLAVVVRVSRASQGILDHPHSRLDERESELKQHAFARAQRISMALGVLLLAIPLFAALPSAPLGFGIDGPARVPLLVLTFYVAVVLDLPFAILGWQLPDPIERDETAPA